MGLLNQPSDGLPSVLFALVRALRTVGPMPKDELLAVCCPPSLQVHTAGFERDLHGRKTLLRWTQLGLFEESGETITLHRDVAALPQDGFGEIRALAPLLRRLALRPDNNRELNQELDQEERVLAADFTLASCWALAQDILALPGGTYETIDSVQSPQFGTSKPQAFQNDTRWIGFRAWAPLLGFGWIERIRGNNILVIDPSAAIREELGEVFGDRTELPIDHLLTRLAQALPVLDGGEYRESVEARLDESAWHRPRPREISVSLSVALKRLEAIGILRLESRADAPKYQLLGRGFRELGPLSHVLLTKAHHA